MCPISRNELSLTAQYSWLYRLFLAVDANFRLKLRDRGIKNDPELGPGNAYFVAYKDYLAVMDTYGDQKEVCRVFLSLLACTN